MFNSTQRNGQLYLLSSISEHSSKAASKVLQDPKHWHNQFYREVFCRIDESIFKNLYCQDNGAPNASIAELISMMILKEAFGYSD